MKVKTAVWFERKFDFRLPIWMYPNVIERLRGTPARLEDRVRGIRDEIRTRKDGKAWSIQEHAGHLFDLEPLAVQRLDDFEAGAETLAAADVQNRRTEEAGHNERPLEEIFADFRRARDEIVRRFEGYDEAFVARSARHPRLGTAMRVIDLAEFFAEHDDHHLARITELLGELGG